MRYLDFDPRKRHSAQGHLAPSPSPSPIKVTPKKHQSDRRPDIRSVTPRNIKKFDMDLDDQSSSITSNPSDNLVKTPMSGRCLNHSFSSESPRVIPCSPTSNRIHSTRLLNPTFASSCREYMQSSRLLWLVILAFLVSWIYLLLNETDRTIYESTFIRSSRPQRWSEMIEIQSIKITRHYPYEKQQEVSSSHPSKIYQRIHPRITHINENKVNFLNHVPTKRKIHMDTAEFTDNTQLYGTHDSDDPALSTMERRTPLDEGGCVPMKAWQSAYLPVCNTIHELALAPTMDEKREHNLKLFGMKGYWRNAWKLDYLGTGRYSSKDNETVVLKTLRYTHNFEDAHFEHDRIDAMAMERLTSSPHVINIYAFCGHTVITEFADGPRLGSLVDKVKKQPLKRLKIARDIASGLADIHGIDGDENATFIHFDVNPANVVVIGDALKFNDFNIGIPMRWNQTSNQRCNVRASYPNPQWRSPEEALGLDSLSEKLDVYSLGNILFRLICGHEPWNKLEIGGKPSAHEISEKVRKGILPHIPEEVWKSDDSEVQIILEAMLRCYTFDPGLRPSARQIANYLDQQYQLLLSNENRPI